MFYRVKWLGERTTSTAVRIETQFWSEKVRCGVSMIKSSPVVLSPEALLRQARCPFLHRMNRRPKAISRHRPKAGRKEGGRLQIPHTINYSKAWATIYLTYPAQRLLSAVRQKVPASQVDRTLYGLNSHEKFRLFSGNFASDSEH